MRLQQDSYSCGVLAIVNAMLCYGRKISERRIKAHSRTTFQGGTDEKGMLAALEALGSKGSKVLESKIRAIVFEELDAHLAAGDPAILCVDEYSHWIAVIGKLGDKYVVFDSLNSKKNAQEHGVHVLTKGLLGRRWKSSKGPFFAILCKRPV